MGVSVSPLRLPNGSPAYQVDFAFPEGLEPDQIWHNAAWNEAVEDALAAGGYEREIVFTGTKDGTSVLVGPHVGGIGSRTNRWWADDAPSRLWQGKPPVSSKEVAKRLEEAGAPSRAEIQGILGPDMPKYLDGVVAHILDRRETILKGEVTRRDLAKAYVMTVMSQGASAQPLSTVLKNTRKAGIPDELIHRYAEGTSKGEAGIRPEEVSAAWLMSPVGKRALDALDEGVVDREAWLSLAEARRSYGRADQYTQNYLLGPKGLGNVERFEQVLAAMNAAGKAGDVDAVVETATQLAGIELAKKGFLTHFIGVGHVPTIDAREINLWVAGVGDLRKATDAEKARLAKGRANAKNPVGKVLSKLITERIGELATERGLDPAVGGHLIHHLLWDRITDSVTTHHGLYEAMRLASGPSWAAGVEKWDDVEAAAEAWKKLGTKSPWFKRWFGKSAVVDEAGEPLVVWHGTAVPGVTQFETYGSKHGLMGQGAYFTESLDVAQGYAETGKGKARRLGADPTPNVMPVYLSLRNPLDMDAPIDMAAWQSALKGTPLAEAEEALTEGMTGEQALRAVEEAAQDANMYDYEGAEIINEMFRAMGHDGLTHIGGGRVRGADEAHRVWIIFDPEQAKSSIGNRGTFDSSSPSILRAAPSADPKHQQRVPPLPEDPHAEVPWLDVAISDRTVPAWHKAAQGEGRQLRVRLQDADEAIKGLPPGHDYSRLVWDTVDFLKNGMTGSPELARLYGHELAQLRKQLSKSGLTEQVVAIGRYIKEAGGEAPLDTGGAALAQVARGVVPINATRAKMRDLALAVGEGRFDDALRLTIDLENIAQTEDKGAALLAEIDPAMWQTFRQRHEVRTRDGSRWSLGQEGRTAQLARRMEQPFRPDVDTYDIPYNLEAASKAIQDEGMTPGKKLQAMTYLDQMAKGGAPPSPDVLAQMPSRIRAAFAQGEVGALLKQLSKLHGEGRHQQGVLWAEAISRLISEVPGISKGAQEALWSMPMDAVIAGMWRASAGSQLADRPDAIAAMDRVQELADHFTQLRGQLAEAVARAKQYPWVNLKAEKSGIKEWLDGRPPRDINPFGASRALRDIPRPPLPADEALTYTRVGHAAAPGPPRAPGASGAPPPGAPPAGPPPPGSPSGAPPPAGGPPPPGVPPTPDYRRMLIPKGATPADAQAIVDEIGRRSGGARPQRQGQRGAVLPEIAAELEAFAKPGTARPTAEELGEQLARQKYIDVPANVFPGRGIGEAVPGGWRYTEKDLAELQDMLNNEHRFARMRRPGVTSDSIAHRIIEDSPVETLRNMAEGKGSNNFTATGKQAMRGVLATMFGGDQWENLRQFPVVTRNALLAVPRMVEHGYGETIRFMREAEDDAGRARLFKYLSGSIVRFKKGRHATSSGVDCIGDLGVDLADHIEGLFDPAQRQRLQEAMDIIHAGGDEEGAAMVQNLEKHADVLQKLLNMKSSPQFLTDAIQAANFGEDALYNGPKLAERLLYYTGVTTRNGVPFAGPPFTRIEGLVRELEAGRGLGNDAAMRIAVLVGGHGQAARGKQIWAQHGVYVSAPHKKAFQAWVMGMPISDEMKPIVDQLARTYGMNPSLVKAGSLESGFYVAKAAREKLGEALARGNRFQRPMSKQLQREDNLTGAFGAAYRMMKVRMTRGLLMIRQRYFFMNTMEHFTQMAMVNGFAAAAQSTARINAQNIVILPGVAHLLRLGEKSGVVSPQATENLRAALQKGGDATAHAIGRLFSTSKYRIEVNPILEGKEGFFQVGGRVYSHQAIRRVAVEQGIFSSFDTSALEVGIRSTREAALERIDASTGAWANLRRSGRDGVNDVMETVTDTAEAWAERERLGAMITLMETGLSPRRAAELTIAALFDYAGSMTKGDRNIMVNLTLPFWAFQKNANRLIMDMLFSPWGAYRLSILRKSQERGAELLTHILYESVVDEYGADVNSMPPKVRSDYSAFKNAVEFGYGPMMKTKGWPGWTPEVRAGIYDAFGTPDVWPEGLRDRLENGVGGPDKVTPGMKKAMRMFLLGEKELFEDGELSTLDETLRLAMEKSEAPGGFRPFMPPKPDPSGLNTWVRDNAGIGITMHMTENVRKWYAAFQNQDPEAARERPYLELFLPPTVITAGMNHVGSMAAIFLLMAAEGVDLALPDGPDKPSMKYDFLPAIQANLRNVADLESAPVPAAILDTIGSANPMPRRVHPWIASLIGPAFSGLDILRVPAAMDPFISGEERQRIAADEAVGVLKEERFYLPPGLISLTFENIPFLGELNQMMLTQFDPAKLLKGEAPFPGSTLERLAGPQGKALMAARLFLQMQVGEVNRHKTARREEPRSPSDTLAPL